MSGNFAFLPVVDTAFQPILSFAHQVPMGYGTLLRASFAGEDCTPIDSFRAATLLGRNGDFEREGVRCYAVTSRASRMRKGRCS